MPITTLNLIAAGGPIVAVLLVLSLFVMTLVLIKAGQFLRCRVLFSSPEGFTKSFIGHWRANEFETARRELNGRRHPQALLLSHAAKMIVTEQLSGTALQDELHRYGAALIAKLRSHLRPIEVIATVAPLIGLLGTVAGMIEAFQAMEAAGKQVDPSVLSGGIWQALLTTAIGLIVAIPASMMHSWFERKVETCSQAMADSMGRLLMLEAKRGEPVAQKYPQAVS